VTRARRQDRAGFSLIEALVALTVAALTLAAIFELQTQMIRGQERAARAIEQTAVQENALALTRDLNPMARPEGIIQLPDGDTVSWTSTPHGRSQTNAGFPGGDGAYEVQLFTVTVNVERADGPPPAPLTFDRVGWRRLGVGGALD
jgi:general secretion pathway protein I